MPVLNEADYLETAVDSVLAQDYAGQKQLILALGPSTDGTTAVATALADAHPELTLVDNPAGHIPDGLNAAIRAAKHDIIIRVDAHSELAPNYTSVGVETLERDRADNAGGIMHAQGRGPLQRAIARAYNSRFGLGGATYHRDGKPGEAESAYLGIFRREPLLAVGLFDTSIRRGEDWELNYRLRTAGYRVWFNPELRVRYWPRATWRHLAQQMLATGAWRAQLVRRYGSQNPWRFFVPGGLVLSVAVSVLVLVLQLTGVLAGLPSLLASVAYLGPLSYVALNLFASLTQQGTLTVTDRLLNVGVFATMHFCWGLGFLKGLFVGAGKTVDRSRSAIA